MRELGANGLFLAAFMSVSCSSEPLGNDLGGNGGGSGAGGEAGGDMNAGSSSVGGASGGEGGVVDAHASCDAATSAFCESIYACFAADELDALDLPPTTAECQLQIYQESGCDRRTAEEFCAEGERYDLVAAQRCIEQSRQATCESIRSGDEFAPGCNEMCTQ